MFDGGERAPARPVWGVAALLLAAGDSLSARFGALAVRGELSGFSRAASGHCYFSLKDSDGGAALVRCAMFRRAAALLEFDPRDGAQVELRGRIGVYEPRGELQVVVEAMQRIGAGSLYEEFLRLRARLEQAGLFDAARKRPIEPMPRRLAVVTSPAAAALRDVLVALARRAPQVEVVLVPAPVQGADAPPALAAALTRAAAQSGADTVLLVRGGGSIEDLWAFNDERVVRAVASCALPVICGVGHETDVTLADLAADLRAPTPTAAAELAAPDQGDQLRTLAQRAESLWRAARRLLDRQAQRLDAAVARMGPAAAAVAVQQQRLRGLAQRLVSAAGAQVPRRVDELERLAQRLRQVPAQPLRLQAMALQARADRLRALDPAGVLSRGYVWIEDAAARPIVSAAAVRPGQGVRAVWSDGVALATVDEVRVGPGATGRAPAEPEPPRPARRRSRP